MLSALSYIFLIYLCKFCCCFIVCTYFVVTAAPLGNYLTALLFTALLLATYLLQYKTLAFYFQQTHFRKHSLRLALFSMCKIHTVCKLNTPPPLAFFIYIFFFSCSASFFGVFRNLFNLCDSPHTHVQFCFCYYFEHINSFNTRIITSCFFKGAQCLSRVCSRAPNVKQKLI